MCCQHGTVGSFPLSLSPTATEHPVLSPLVSINRLGLRVIGCVQTQQQGMLIPLPSPLLPIPSLLSFLFLLPLPHINPPYAWGCVRACVRACVCPDMRGFLLCVTVDAAFFKLGRIGEAS